MCFPADALPAVPQIRGAEVDHCHHTLHTADGNEYLAFSARGDRPGGPAVVVLPDVRGLFPFYEELALRFAEHGYDSVVIDYFGRTAGLDARDNDFDFMAHVRQTTQDGVRADTAAAIAQLRTDAPERSVFTVGFCFGGSNSWHQAANGLGLTGAIGFYGHPNRSGVPIGSTPMISRVGAIECPVLGLMGGDDPGIPESEVAPFREALTAAGVGGGIITYPGAPHSFFDRTYEEHAAASADAWQRIVDFIAEFG